jgi:sugar phosphate isomerase/epimerase
MAWKLALHTGSIGTSSLDVMLRAAKETGWDGIELRHMDFARMLDGGMPIADILALVQQTGLPVTAVGVERGWVYSTGAERARLLASITEVCRWAVELGAPIVMSPMDAESGDLDQAAASLREVGDIVAAHGKTMALELNVSVPQFCILQNVRDLLARAKHPNLGLLVDTYHIERGEGGLQTYQGLNDGEIAYFQYSDVPNGPMDPPGNTQERLPPGQGVVPFADILPIITAKGYTGYLSYEGLNTAANARDPFEVAAEALAASRAVLK